MIRRPANANDGGQRWVLISQLEHARLAGQLARHWQSLPTGALGEELRAAIDHHDDGWFDWERRPQVDARSGWPLNFLEMPLDDSVAIWRESIRVGQGLGDLPAWLIAGHFSALLRRYGDWQCDPERLALAHQFLDECDALRDRWLQRWMASDPEHNTLPGANEALAWLQFFDALSLWFCCQQRCEPVTQQPPVGPPIRFDPRDPNQICVDPWPLDARRLKLCVAGTAVAAVRYDSAAALASAAGEPVELSWTLSGAED